MPYGRGMTTHFPTPGKSAGAAGHVRPSAASSLGPGADVVQLLEATRRVAHSYGLPASVVKPCVAFLLDGNLGATGRHDAAFVIAADLRGAGLDRAKVEAVLLRWASRIGYQQRRCQRAVASAFAKSTDGRSLRSIANPRIRRYGSHRT